MAKNKIVSFIKFPPIIFFLVIVLSYFSVQVYMIYSVEEIEQVDTEIEVLMSYLDRQYEFNPDTVTLKPGMKVRFIFKNDGFVNHNFAPQEQQTKGNDPLIIPPGDSVSIVWTVPQDISELTTISYICTYHDCMELDVLVEP